MSLVRNSDSWRIGMFVAKHEHGEPMYRKATS